MKPIDITDEAWDAVEGLVEAVQEHRIEGKVEISRAIMAAIASEREACATHLESRGEALYVDYNDTASYYLCRDLADELRKRGEP